MSSVTAGKHGVCLVNDKYRLFCLSFFESLLDVLLGQSNIRVKEITRPFIENFR
jgi:hypothetical protein